MAKVLEILPFGLFGGGKTPSVAPPKTAPTPDDDAIRKTKSRRAALAQQQSGIRSAVLTGAGSRETLGG